MATIFPGALWRPMPGQEKRPARRKGRGVGYHIAVTERDSIYDINLGTGNDAHLYVRRDGSVEQNVDLDLQAWAGRDGNSSMIWVETQGGTTPADVTSGRWTAQQAETLAQIAAWANRTEGVPLQLMPNSLAASRGLGTHRLGIQHSRGVGAVPGWLIAGGELWSSSVGKECPGDARIAQLAEVRDRAVQIVGGPAPAPAGRKRPLLPVWDLKVGQYLGHKNGPAASIGGFNGPLFIIEAVQCAMVFLDCVAGVPAASWESSTWSDGVWEDQTSVACRRLYAKFDFGNETFTDRIYREDYEVLRRIVAAA